jgi:hypothetical protein
MEGTTGLRDVFQDALHCAITHGQQPYRWIGLGDESHAAIDAVAQEHPEATVDQIAYAYDAFAREHGASDQADPMESEPHRFEARRDRFRRA